VAGWVETVTCEDVEHEALSGYTCETSWAFALLVMVAG
jgi:hypothetical protein